MDSAMNQRFTDAMMHTYHAALKLGYKASYFLRMVIDLGAVPAAKQLIHDPKFSSGFMQLWELNALGLTVEALVLKDEWRELFDDRDRKAAKEKLDKLNYPFTNIEV